MSKMMRWGALLKTGWIAILLVLTFASACKSLHPAGSQRIVDDLGRPVNIAKAPERIVSLAPSNTEILFALGLEEKVVGVTEHCNYPPEALQKQKVGGFATPDIEKILALQPDLILAAEIHRAEIIPALEERGLTVFALAPQGLDSVLQNIEIVGRITGKEEEASQLVQNMKKRIEAVSEKSKRIEQRPRVFYLTWHDPLWTAGSGTFIHELIEKAGGVNIFHDISGHKAINIELLIARNPEVIIACTGHGEAKDQPFEWCQNEPRLAATDARKNHRVYQIDADLVSRSGPRIVNALESFAYFIHPEIFVETESSK